MFQLKFEILIIRTEYIAKDSLPFKDKPAVDGTNFGYPPKMDTTSKSSICSLLFSSVCERINSQANQVYLCVRCSVIVTVSVCLRVTFTQWSHVYWHFIVYPMGTVLLLSPHPTPLTGREWWKCFVGWRQNWQTGSVAHELRTHEIRAPVLCPSSEWTFCKVWNCPHCWK